MSQKILSARATEAPAMMPFKIQMHYRGLELEVYYHLKEDGTRVVNQVRYLDTHPKFSLDVDDYRHLHVLIQKNNGDAARHIFSQPHDKHVPSRQRWANDRALQKPPQLSQRRQVLQSRDLAERFSE